jgi:hypothetical protein
MASTPSVPDVYRGWCPRTGDSVPGVGQARSPTRPRHRPAACRLDEGAPAPHLRGVEIAEYVGKAIDDWERRSLEPALLLALSAVDGTATKAFSGMRGSRDRFVRLVDEHLWLVEPLLAIGVNLETTRFAWIRLRRRESRFSEVLYEVFRCNLAHGSPIPGGSGLTVRFSDWAREATFAPDQVILPDTVIFALLAVAVFAPINADQRVGRDYYLSHATRKFVIDEWWGREDEVKAYFAEELGKLPRVTMNF